jgi:hypothetical protein
MPDRNPTLVVINSSRKAKRYRVQILSPGLRDKVDHGIGLSYWPASLCSLAGRYEYL